MDNPGDIGPLAPADGEPGQDEPPQTGWLSIEVVEEAGEWADLAAVDGLVERVRSAVCADGRVRPPFDGQATLCIAFGDDAMVRSLNGQFRGKDSATNVLSFPAGFMPAETGEPRFLGDVVLACETVRSEAAERSLAPGDHIQHLILHGVLHLLGYDHECPADAEVMEGVERRILATIGIADPYSDHD